MPVRVSLTQPVWRQQDPERPAPPVDASLAGWEIQKRRRSHWNACRVYSGETYFLKWFFHTRWSNPARREWENARSLAALGIPTVLPVGWGVHSHGSYVVLLGSPGFQADKWERQCVPARHLQRHALRLASYVARLHDARLCHRDLNVYHVLLYADTLRLIDVGRVMTFVRRRWIVKDLASLLYSARRERIPPYIYRLFFRTYLQTTRRNWKRRRILQAVEMKAERYRRHNA